MMMTMMAMMTMMMNQTDMLLREVGVRANAIIGRQEVVAAT